MSEPTAAPPPAALNDGRPGSTDARGGGSQWPFGPGAITADEWSDGDRECSDHGTGDEEDEGQEAQEHALIGRGDNDAADYASGHPNTEGETYDSHGSNCAPPTGLIQKTQTGRRKKKLKKKKKKTAQRPRSPVDEHILRLKASPYLNTVRPAQGRSLRVRLVELQAEEARLLAAVARAEGVNAPTLKRAILGATSPQRNLQSGTILPNNTGSSSTHSSTMPLLQRRLLVPLPQSHGSHARKQQGQRRAPSEGSGRTAHDMSGSDNRVDYSRLSERAVLQLAILADAEETARTTVSQEEGSRWRQLQRLYLPLLEQVFQNCHRPRSSASTVPSGGSPQSRGLSPCSGALPPLPPDARLGLVRSETIARNHLGEALWTEHQQLLQAVAGTLADISVQLQSEAIAKRRHAVAAARAAQYEARAALCDAEEARRVAVDHEEFGAHVALGLWFKEQASRARSDAVRQWLQNQADDRAEMVYLTAPEAAQRGVLDPEATARQAMRTSLVDGVVAIMTRQFAAARLKVDTAERRTRERAWKECRLARWDRFDEFLQQVEEPGWRRAVLAEEQWERADLTRRLDDTNAAHQKAAAEVVGRAVVFAMDAAELEEREGEARRHVEDRERAADIIGAVTEAAAAAAEAERVARVALAHDAVRSAVEAAVASAAQAHEEHAADQGRQWLTHAAVLAIIEAAMQAASSADSNDDPSDAPESAARRVTAALVEEVIQAALRLPRDASM